MSTAPSVRIEAAPSTHDTQSPSTALAVQTHGLTKRFGRFTAVDGVDLAVPAGTVYGFLGPNGSGKTTTIRMLLGLAEPSAGEIRVLDGRMPGDRTSVLARVGALVEAPAAYPFLTGAASLRRMDAADRMAPVRTRKARVEQALDRVGLTSAAGTKVRAYSLGMKQRLGIAAALLQPRDLLVLDEPTNGLDPQGTREVRNLVRGLAADGTTVLVSSHLLAEVEQMCQHVGVMSGGRLVAQGTLASFGADDPGRVRVRSADPGAVVRVLTGLGLPGAEVDGETVRAPLPPGAPPVADVVVALVRAGVPVHEVGTERDSLEDRFVALTGEGFDVVR